PPAPPPPSSLSRSPSHSPSPAPSRAPSSSKLPSPSPSPSPSPPFARASWNCGNDAFPPSNWTPFVIARIRPSNALPRKRDTRRKAAVPFLTVNFVNMRFHRCMAFNPRSG
ncbi:MAG: hypothetical protein F4050_17690, partial [Rhodospirillaceae bacterium]|nr:hypothetical protein [Rhodospirillaceae bacterium]